MMGKRSAEDEEWKVHKNEILRLYQAENNPLPKVISLMTSEFGFRRSKTQYELRLKKWGIRKNSKEDEWKAIARRVRHRDALKLPTAVEIRGTLIPSQKMRKEMTRYGYQSTFDRFTSDLAERQRSETPPGIRIFTPSRPLSPCGMRPSEVTEYGLVTLASPLVKWTDEMILHLADQTPWRIFMQYIDSLDLTATDQLLRLPSLLHNSEKEEIFPSPPHIDLIETMRYDQRVDGACLEHWIDDMVCELYTLGINDSYVPDTCMYPSRYLPPNREGTSDIDMTAIIDNSSKSTQLELLKQAVNLLSNDFDTGDVGAIVAELARDEHNLRLIKSLLDQQILVTQAFSEKLLAPAAKKGNIPLMKILLESGCDVNIKSRDGLFKRSAIDIAVDEQHEKLVTFLLSRGANRHERGVHVSYITSFRGTIIEPEPVESLIDLAVKRGNQNILKDLLTPHPRLGYGNVKISTNALLWAIINSDFETFHLLLSYHPGLLDQARLEPWILLEAAAIQGSVPLFSTVLCCGLDVNQTNERNEGSALAAASASGSLDLVNQVLELGTNPCSTAMGFALTAEPRASRYPFYRYCLNLKPRFIRGLSALHLAMASQNVDIANTLISSGANVDQCCLDVVPLQLAVYYRNIAAVDMLLEAGANPNVSLGCSPKFVSSNNVIECVVGRPPIQIALEAGSTKIFERLIRGGADIPRFLGPHFAWDPLISAARGDRFTPEALEACILHCGCDLARELIIMGYIHPRDLYHAEVIAAAVFQGDKDFVQQLLQNATTDLGDLPPAFGATGFSCAMIGGLFSMASLFLSVGVKPFEHGKCTRSLIDRYPDGSSLCVLEGFFRSHSSVPRELAILLIDACDEPERHTAEHNLWEAGLVAACITTMTKKHLEYTPLIIAKGIDINSSIDLRGNLLHCSLLCRAVHISDYLLDLGCDPNASHGIAGKTSIQIASTTGHVGLFKRLLDRGAYLFAKPAIYNGATAVQFAAMYGNFEILNIALQAGADVNEPPGQHQGRTAIEGAAEHGRLNMVRYLLEAGADMRGKNNRNYRRTIFRAWGNDHRTLVRMIQDWKVMRYGEQDCSPVENIIRSMTTDELDFESPAAKVEFEEWLNGREGEKYVWDEGEEKRDLETIKSTLLDNITAGKRGFGTWSDLWAKSSQTS